MTIVSFVALFVTLLIMSAALTRVTMSRVLTLVFLLIVHVSASIYYRNYAKGAVTDTSLYYYDPYNWYVQPWSFGTIMVIKLCHILKVDLGATYLDTFIVFQSIGFAGLIIMVKLFDEIEEKCESRSKRGYLFLLFLPSVNFWTSAIGKDAPLFFALALCAWAVLKLRQRFVWFCVSIGVMVLFRAHIALLAAGSLAAAAVFEKSITSGRKIGLLAIAIGGMASTVGAVRNTLGVDVTSISELSTYVSNQNALFATVGGTTSLGHAPFPIRVISLLFRPFFFDANGAMGVVASFENVGAVLAMIYVLMHWRNLAHLVRRVFFIRFVMIFAFMILFMLSLLYYNVGLGLRERIMAYPMIFSALVALWSVQRRVGEAGRQPLEQPVRGVETSRPISEV